MRGQLHKAEAHNLGQKQARDNPAPAQVRLASVSEPTRFLPDSPRPSCEAPPQQVPRGIDDHDKKTGLNRSQGQIVDGCKRQSFLRTELRPSLLKTISVVQELILYALVPTHKLWDGETAQNEMERAIQEERWGRRESGNNRAQK